jgi:HK97 family phage prohead protease
MKENSREVRIFLEGRCQPHLREAADGGESRTIEGYAIVFGVRSVLLADWYDRYYEVIEPGAIDEARLREMDIKMTMFHDREILLARSNKGQGTLKLSVDEVGVKYGFEAPRTCDGDNALELVRRGDLSGSSFTFWSDERSSIRYELLDDDVLLRHVDRIDKVYEMTIAADPAYVETTVTAREVEAAGIKLPNHSKDERETPEQIAEKLRENKSRIDSLRSIANSNTF